MSKQNIYKAMGSMAYAIAIADGEIQEEEKNTIRRLALEEFELSDIDNVWITNMFQELEDKNISLEEAYRYAMDVLESNRFDFDFDEGTKKKCLKFIERTAESFEGVDLNERQILNRLKTDLSGFVNR